MFTNRSLLLGAVPLLLSLDPIWRHNKTIELWPPLKQIRYKRRRWALSKLSDWVCVRTVMMHLQLAVGVPIGLFPRCWSFSVLVLCNFYGISIEMFPSNWKPPHNKEKQNKTRSNRTERNGIFTHVCRYRKTVYFFLHKSWKYCTENCKCAENLQIIQMEKSLITIKCFCMWKTRMKSLCSIGECMCFP